jgi:hypothetical protein
MVSPDTPGGKGRATRPFGEGASSFGEAACRYRVASRPLFLPDPPRTVRRTKRRGDRRCSGPGLRLRPPSCSRRPRPPQPIFRSARLRRCSGGTRLHVDGLLCRHPDRLRVQRPADGPDDRQQRLRGRPDQHSAERRATPPASGDRHRGQRLHELRRRHRLRSPVHAGRWSRGRHRGGRDADEPGAPARLCEPGPARERVCFPNSAASAKASTGWAPFVAASATHSIASSSTDWAASPMAT